LTEHQVLVSNVQTEGSPPSDEDSKSQAPTRSLLVTFAVDNDTAERIVVVANKGEIWLAAEETEGAATAAGAAQ
jgi:hypothetical protein